MKKIFLLLIAALAVLAVSVSCGTEIEQPAQILSKAEVCERLSAYRVVMPIGSNQLISNAMSMVAMQVGATSNGTPTYLKVGVDKNADAVLEIDIGETSRAASKKFATGLGPMDYTIRSMSDGRIVIVGGTTAATAAGAVKFVEMVNDGSFNNLQSFEYTYRFYECHQHDPLCNLNSAEAKAFIAEWKTSFTSPSWGGVNRDLKESLYALTHKFTSSNGRVAVFAHRGDMGHYPENSLPGIISALMSGADTIEFDYRFTKDYVAVVFHDESLARMTNYTELAGTNGLPTSPYIKDWTYDQLMQLSLLDYDKNVTSYKIATVYDGLLLVAGRMQVSFDDKSSSGVSFDDFLIPMAKATNAGSSLILTTYRNFKKYDILTGLVSEDLLTFAKNCGSFIGAYSFYSNSTYFSNNFGSNYISLAEDSTTWNHLIDDLGKRYVGTNQCYALSVYMRNRGMTAWKY